MTIFDYRLVSIGTRVPEMIPRQ